MEKLAIAANPNVQVEMRWELIPGTNLSALPAIFMHLSAPLNENEILIFGGYSYRESKVHIYDTSTDSVTSVAVKGNWHF